MAIDELEENVNKELSRQIREKESFPYSESEIWDGEIIPGKMHEDRRL